METLHSIEILTKDRINTLRAEGMERKAYQHEGAMNGQQGGIISRIYLWLSGNRKNQSDTIHKGIKNAVKLGNTRQV